MTATVTSLASRRKPEATCDCARHQLDALAARVRGLLDQDADALLIPRERLAAALEDLTATTDRLLPPRERTGQ